MDEFCSRIFSCCLRIAARTGSILGGLEGCGGADVGFRCECSGGGGYGGGCGPDDFVLADDRWRGGVYGSDCDTNFCCLICSAAARFIAIFVCCSGVRQGFIDFDGGGVFARFRGGAEKDEVFC